MTSNTINTAPTIAENAEGTLLAGRYRIVRQLGQGGMGSVWLAEDTLLDGKPFAIKMLPAILVANKRAYRQLKDEALVAMKLTHPNIVTLRAFEENDGNPFLVMDYVDGQTLDDYLADKGGLPEADVLRILRPIAAALDYAHGEGVVHRDVKPANVMIRKDGHPFILDFGIAREIQETMTRVTGKLSSGTLLYMSPEQLNGASPKPAQDVYSFAAMVYECLKGEAPFARGQIEYQILNNPPPPLVGRGVLDAPLAASVMAGLAKKPEDRPASCTAILGGKTVVSPKDAGAVALVATETGSSPVPRPNERKSDGGWKVLLAAALLVLAGGAWYYHHLQQEREEVRLAAERQAASDIRAEANVWQGKVSRIADSDGFTARKENLADDLARAEALFDERTKRWSEAAQGFSNYVGQAEALVKLDGERQSAAATRARAEEAKSRAAEAESEKYALSCWTNAVWSLETGNGEFQAMRFVSASNAFVSAAAQFGRCVDTARTERTRLLAVAARDLAMKAKDNASQAEAEMYAATCWTNAVQLLESGNGEFQAMRYSQASNVFASAAVQFGKCAEEAHRVATVATAYRLFESCKYKELLQGADMKDSTLPDVLYLQGLVLMYGLKGTCDIPAAVQKLEAAAKEGHALATAELGEVYCCGYVVKRDEVRGKELLEKGKREVERLANIGNTYAQNLLGSLYSSGLGYATNKVLAAQWYGRASERGFVFGMENYGYCLLNGKGTETNTVAALDLLERACAKGSSFSALLLGLHWKDKDKERAKQWFGKCRQVILSAAEQGAVFSQLYAGFLYENGWWGETNSMEAVRWYTKSAEQGNANAQGNLGWMYWNGTGVRQDYWTAVKWLRKAADQGNAGAQNAMGLAYSNGRGVEKDYDKALEWYTKSAEQGFAFGQSNLGGMYWDGKGVRQDYWTAVRWLRKAADQGLAEAQNLMGRAYEQGWGVEKDYDKVLEWYRKAAEQSFAVAQFNLGRMYWDGKGVRKDYWMAVRWIRKAADQGLAAAQGLMGRAYEKGWGEEKDLGRAFEWYSMAAEKGDATAQNNLGCMYWEGNGVQQNYWKAVPWIRKAAEQGESMAQWNLGKAYEEGNGVGKDLSEAIRWYRKAAEQGHPDAVARLRQLGYR